MRGVGGPENVNFMDKMTTVEREGDMEYIT